MITLPYAFDTTTTWQRIVKIVFAVAGVLLLAIMGGLLSGKFGGAVGLSIAIAILWWVARRVRGFPMGAAGTLTQSQVETRPVTVLWYSLPVPVGRFSIDRFDSIGVIEHVYIPQTAGTATNTGSVQLMGKAGTPNIEVAVRDIDDAITVASELGNLLRLPVKRMDAPGSRTVRITVG